MAGKGLTIPLSLDPREWLRGIKVVERSLEGMEDELDEVERAGDKLERALEDNFKDAARAAERAGSDMDDGLGKGLKGGAIGTVGGEVAEEFTQNFGEAIRSGNPTDAILETFTSLGPALGLLGIGAAVVAGIVNGINEEKARLTEAIKTRFADAADTALESGAESGKAFVSEFNAALADEAGQRAALQDFYDTDSFIDALSEAAKEAESVGVNMATVQDLVSGTTIEQARATEEVRSTRDAAQQVVDRWDDAAAVQGDIVLAANEEYLSAKRQVGEANRLLGVGEQIRAERQRSLDLATEYEASQGRATSEMQNQLRAAIGLNRELDNAARGRIIRLTYQTFGTRIAGVTGQGGPTV